MRQLSRTWLNLVKINTKNSQNLPNQTSTHLSTGKIITPTRSEVCIADVRRNPTKKTDQDYLITNEKAWEFSANAGGQKLYTLIFVENLQSKEKNPNARKKNDASFSLPLSLN